MSSNEIKAIMALYWRYKRQAVLIAFERGLSWTHVPDVQIVSKDRRLIEVEIKVSASDFRADAKKHVWSMRDRGLKPMPYQFYYAMPMDMAEKLKDEVRNDCGLLGVRTATMKWQGHADRVECVRRAPVHKAAGRLSLKQCAQMAKHQTGTLCSMAERLYIPKEGS